VRRLCERPGCGDQATVAYGFDPARRVAWLQPAEPDAAGGVLCRRHADAMVVPRGWTLDDRRIGDPRIEPVEVAGADPTGDWSPVGVARTELADVLDASTPLLARAFGQARPLTPPSAATG
jgi:hypothetical protein